MKSLLFHVLTRVWAIIPSKIRLILRPFAQFIKRKRSLRSIEEYTKQNLIDASYIEKFSINSSLALGQEPLVSIVVTSYNDAAFINDCLLSIRLQDIDSWECVVVDDASSDSSVDIATRHCQEDRRFRVVRRQENGGLAAARNTGIFYAQGRYLTFLDADDFMFPRTLEKRIASTSDTNPNCAGSWCDFSMVPEESLIRETPPTKVRPSIELIDYFSSNGENKIISSAAIIRSEVMRSLDGYDEDFYTAEDFEFNTRLLRNGFFLKFSDNTAIAYRQKKSSMISTGPHEHVVNAFKIYGYMMSEMSEDSICDLAESPIRHAIDGIPLPVNTVKRAIVFLTFAFLIKDSEQIDRILQLIDPVVLREKVPKVQIVSAIQTALLRHEIRGNRISLKKQREIEKKVMEILNTRKKLSRSSLRTVQHKGSISGNRINAHEFTKVDLLP